MVFEHTSAIETRRCHERWLRFASRLTARRLCDWRELPCGAHDRRRSSDRFEARKAARPIDCARRRRRHFGRRACEHCDGNETVLNCKLVFCSAWCLFRVVPSDQTLFCFDRGGSRCIATECVSGAVRSNYCDAPNARLGKKFVISEMPAMNSRSNASCRIYCRGKCEKWHPRRAALGGTRSPNAP